MGTFDYVTCNYPLPGIPPGILGKTRAFQTKDLVCNFEEYIISEDGQLFRRVEKRGPWPTNKLKAVNMAPVSDVFGPVEFYCNYPEVFVGYFSGGKMVKVVKK